MKPDLYQIIENCNDSIVISDMTKEIEPIIYVNKSFEELTLYSKEDIIGTNCRFMQGEDKNQPNIKIIREAIKKGKKVKTILKNYKKDGTVFWNELSLSPIFDDSGKVHFYIGIQNDVSHRIQRDLEKQSLYKQIKDANEAKNKFIAEMNHDLKTPLNAIIGYCQLLLVEESKENLKKEQIEDIQKIFHSAEHLLEIIQNNLSISEIEKNKIKLNLQPINIFQSLEECLILVEPLAKKQEVTFHFHTKKEELLIIGDKIKLKEVFTNLLSNAIKYNTKGGKIIINIYEQDSMVQIDIKDTGIGIREEDYDKVFSLFERFGEYQNIEEGNGIGLSLVERLIESMQGEIFFSSKENKGTTFSVKLQNAIYNSTLS